ncbi:MAG TPA: saccharopine dehydrogenase NADP-binding domain-containing protein [Phnomibacter sp.]|nr:saccharopine dehydrogenase NADP-binding domain-containing protein [Phnomibacter sp.]
MKHRLLIYGANGYTGRLICEEAARRGMQPILAGRNAGEIHALAGQYGWEARAFSLDDVQTIADNLHDVAVVQHAAGPFRFTARPMMEACLLSATHYLDITGEIDVFQLAYSHHLQALEKNIMLMPGTGFDVVPTDCLALGLKEKMPDATSIELAFVTLGGQISHGTAMSMSEKLGEGGCYRRNGELVKEPLGKHGKTLDLDGRSFFVMSIPWGDVYTAYHTTGIPNVRAYTGAPKAGFWFMKLHPLFTWVLRSQWFKRWLQKKINQRPAGPDAAKRAKAISYLWGEVTGPTGNKVSAWFKCAEGYSLTALTAIDIAQKVLQGNWRPGYHTPAGCYGAGLVDPYKK